MIAFGQWTGGWRMKTYNGIVGLWPSVRWPEDEVEVSKGGLNYVPSNAGAWGKSPFFSPPSFGLHRQYRISSKVSTANNGRSQIECFRSIHMYRLAIKRYRPLCTASFFTDELRRNRWNNSHVLVDPDLSCPPPVLLLWLQPIVVPARPEYNIMKTVFIMLCTETSPLNRALRDSVWHVFIHGRYNRLLWSSTWHLRKTFNERLASEGKRLQTLVVRLPNPLLLPASRKR